MSNLKEPADFLSFCEKTEVQALRRHKPSPIVECCVRRTMRRAKSSEKSDFFCNQQNVIKNQQTHGLMRELLVEFARQTAILRNYNNFNRCKILCRSRCRCRRGFLRLFPAAVRSTLYRDSSRNNVTKTSRKSC